MRCRVSKCSCLFLLLILINNALAQTFTAATSNTTTICAGNQVTVAYSASANFGAGNQVIVELSNAAGSFASPVTLNTANTTAASGSYNVTIPAATVGSNFYRIRVRSTNPANTFLVGTIFTIASQAQCACTDKFKIDWQASFGGNATDNFSVVVPMADGGYLLGGHSTSNANTGNKTSPAYSGSQSYWLVKVDASGTKLWDSTYGGSGNDQLLKIIPTPDGGYLLSGTSQSAQNTGNKTAPKYGVASVDYWVIKINSDGVKQWEQSYGGDQNNIPFDAVPAADGGYFLAGQSNSPISGTKTAPLRGDGDYWLVKIDDTGNQLWDSTYGGTNIDQMRSIAATPDGGFLLAGRSRSLANGTKTVSANVAGVFDYYVVKINANGQQQWDNRYGGTGADDLSHIIPATDGNYLLVGHSASAAATGQKTAPLIGSTDIWVVKIDSSGTQLWDSTYGGSGAEINTSVMPSRDGGFYIAAQSFSGATGNKTLASFGNNDLWVLKIDGNGVIKEQYAYGSTANDNMSNNHQIWPTADGGFIVGGSSAGGLTGNKTVPTNGLDDYWIIKVSPNIQLSATARTSTVCAGNELTIDYSTSCGTFNLGNNISIELSNAAGSFASPTLLNTAATIAASDSFNVTIPSATPGGEFYKIRVISSNPVDTVVIGKIFTIVPPAQCNCTNDLISNWQRSFGGIPLDDVQQVLPTVDGGYLFAGASLSPPGGNKTSPLYGTQNFWLVKTDALGNMQWDSSYGGNGSESLNAIVHAQDGGYLFGGSSNSSVLGTGNLTSLTFGGNDFWLVKTNENGVIQWQRNYGGTSPDVLRSIVPTSDGGYLLGGSSQSGITGNKTSASFGNSDYWIVKIDVDGNIEWDKAYGGLFADELRSVLPLSDGGFLLAGYSNSNISGLKSENRNGGAGINDFWIVKIDANGNFIWDKTIGGTGNDELAQALLLNDGNVLLIGQSGSSTATGVKTALFYGGTNDTWVVKIDQSGNILWNKAYGGAATDLPFSASPLANGQVMISVTSNSVPDPDPTVSTKTLPNFGTGNDVWLVLIDNDGTQVKDYVYGANGGDNARRVFPTSDGGVILTAQGGTSAGGNKTVSSNGSNDMWIAKLGGNVQLSATARTSTICAGEDLTVDYANIGCGNFNAGNNIRIELSNAAGSFASPTLLNTAATTANSGNYTVTIPAATPGGEFYRIRVISSNPVDTVIISSILTIVPQAICTCSDDFVIDWQISQGGTGFEVLNIMLPTADGGYLLGGFSPTAATPTGTKTFGGYGGNDYWIVKLDANGNKLWDSCYGGADDDLLRSIIPTSDGGFLLGGSSRSNSMSGNKTATAFGNNDYWVVKINANGIILWDRSYGGSLSETFSSIIPTNDGGFLLLGDSRSVINGSKTAPNYGDEDFWAVKIDANGNQLWDQSYGGSNFDLEPIVIASADGGFLLAGYSRSPVSGSKTATNYGNDDYWVVKIDINGDQLWDNSYGGTGEDVLNKTAPTADGGFLLGGQSTSTSNGNKTAGNFGFADYWVVKINASGTPVWDYSYGGSNSDFLYDIIQAKDDGFFLAGPSNSPANGNKTIPTIGNDDYWLVKIDANGIKTKEYGFGGTSFDIAVSLVPTADGGLFVAGFSNSGINGNKTVATNGSRDYWVLKLGGNVQLSATARTTTICAGEDLTVDYANTGCGNFGAGNNIRIELSNAAGSFASSTLLNTDVTTANSGNYSVTIPAATPGGEFYKIRVIGSNPVDTVIIGKLFTIISQADCSCPDDLVVEWQISEGGSTVDIFNVILPTADGGYLLGGRSQSAAATGTKTSPNYGNYDYWLVKIDANGTKLWDSSYGGSEFDEIWSILPTSDGGYLLGGYSSSTTANGNKIVTGNGQQDYWMIKINADGVRQWERSYGGTSIDFFTSMTATEDGGFLLSGYSQSDVNGTKTAPRIGNYDYWVVKIDADGNQLWDKTYGGSLADMFPQIIPAADGGFLVGGFSSSPADGTKTRPSLDADYWVVKIDNEGNQLWDSVYGGSSAETLNKMAPTADGGFLLGGYSNSIPSGQKTSINRGSNDYWLVKINANGTQLWDSTYGGNGNDDLYDLIPAKDGGFYLSGQSSSPANGNKTLPSFVSFDYWVVKMTANGVKTKEYAFGGTGLDQQRAIYPTSNGGFIIGGYTSSIISGNKTVNTNGNVDYWILQLSPPPKITPVNINASSFCTGDSIDIEFDINDCGNFNSANVFTYQLSDSLGSFAVPTILGIAPNTTSRDTTLALPLSLPSSTAYRIRILASNPVVISDTSAAFTINTTPDLSAGISVSCANGLVISVPNQGTGVTYQWQDNLVNIPSANSREFAPIEQGTYRIIVSRGTCRDTAGTYTLTYAIANGGKVITLPDGADRLVCDSLTTRVMMRVDDNVDSKSHTNTSTNMYVVPTTPTYNGQPYVRRYWDVTPPAPKDKPATLTFYVTQADFNNFNDSAIGWPPLPTGPADAIGIGNLVVSVFHGNSATNLPATYNGRAEYKLSGVSVTVNWNAAINLWEISLPVDSFSGFFVHTIPAVLPVTLTKFTGSFDEEVPGVVLNWETASERDCNYFVVEKLMDNGQYKAIGTVPCFGNSNIPREYIFTDINFNNGSNIYRLKQVDYNGQFEYSKSIDVPVILPDRFNFKAWTDQVFIYTEVSEEGQINILDIQGRIVRSFPAIAGQRVQLFAANWPSGLYLVNFTNDNNQQTKKVILQR